MLEVINAKEAEVGGLTVRRAFPRRGLRTVGAWCFADHFGPEIITPDSGLDVGPHPHIGLHTVTWLLDGAVRHNDSLGSDQLIRPGQLNLMTAGHGVVHSEQSDRQRTGSLHGLQLWIAQTDDTRHGAPDFAHHAQLPGVELGNGEATILLGEFAGQRSGASVDSDLLGLDMQLTAGSALLPLRTDYEYALYVVTGDLTAAGPSGEAHIGPGQLLPLPPGATEVTLTVPDQARALLLGGMPLEQPLFMWWNFVARTREEAAQASADWLKHWQEGDDARFARVDSPLPAIPGPALP